MTNPIDHEMDLRVKYTGDVFQIVERIDPTTGRALEFVKAPDVVRVYATDGEYLWLIREKRPGLGGQRHLRAVSGSVEPGERPEAAAARELAEEAGIVARRFECFHESSPGLKMLYRVLHFTCTVESVGEQSLETGEDITREKYPMTAVRELAWNDHFAEDLTAFAALKLARRHLRSD